MAVPKHIAAKVLFMSDRICCVCRTKGKPVQIHHLDGDESNNKLENLAVLCLDCHTETQIRGGFHRKLDAEQIVLYREDWYASVSRERAIKTASSMKEDMDSKVKLERATSLAEIYKERRQYELLAIHYNVIGNSELRDKYIEKCIERGVADELHIFFRSLQGKVDLVPQDVIERETAQLKSEEAWSQLARLYRDLKQWDQAAYYYCKSIMEDIDQGNTFAAAFYLKEMFKEDIDTPLFEEALRKAMDEKDLWWQMRALQELEWTEELAELLIKHKEEIEQSGDPMLLRQLYWALGDTSKMLEMEKEIARRTSFRGIKKR